MDTDCDTKECDAPVDSGRGIAVYKKGYDCTQILKAGFNQRAAAIPVQLTEKKVALVDGSAGSPLQLSNLQLYTGSTVPTLLAALPDGTIVRWVAPTGDKKIVAKNGYFTHEDDYSSDLFKGGICAADCDEVESSLGVKEIVISKIGEPVKTMYQVCRIPKCCCTAEDFPSLV